MNESNLGNDELLDRGRYYGTALSWRATAEVTLAESRYASDSRIPSHAHRSPYLCLVLDGWFEETWGSHRDSCGPGTLVFHSAHEVHADRFGAAGARCFNLELGPRLAERLADEGALPRSRLTLGPGRGGAMLAALRVAPVRSRMEIEEAVLGLLAELMPLETPPAGRGPRPAWMERSIERLRSPLPPSIASLAEEAGVHPVYFTRVFRAALCATPSAVAQQARLERATTELLQSDARVAAIAHQAGFADHSHFCRQFKRTVGVTPSDYRKIFGHDLSQAWPLGRAQGDDDVVPPGSSSG